MSRLMMAAGLTVGLMTVLAGCHRGYYRRQADAEVQALVRQKATHSRWSTADGAIDVARESRMYDPFSSDHPPMPPDDPASHELMERVDDKPGYPHWHANGDTPYVESPDWLSFLPLDASGMVVIDSRRAVQLALTHATTFQRQREELYLAALEVTLERFGFDTQAFAGWNSFFTAAGSGDSTTLDGSTSGSGIQLRRLGATGSTLVVGLANSIVWQFAGADTQTASSLIDFSLVQPLLRGAGRDRILESLTQAERALLANVRQFERFRSGFFLQVTVGRTPGAGVNRSGNFLSSPSLGSGNAGGLLGLLRTQQNIRIREFNVASLRNVLDQFIEFRRAERLDALQLNQAESSLYSAQQQLLTLRTTYQTQLDTFKRTLGLPPWLPVRIEDDFLNPFELIDDQNNQRQNELNRLKVTVGEVLLSTSAFLEQNRFPIDDGQAPPPEDPDVVVLIEKFGIRWSPELRQEIEKIAPLLDQINPMLRTVHDQDVGRIQQDIERLRVIRPRREAQLAELRELIRGETEVQYDLETGILEGASLEDPALLAESLSTLVTKLDEIDGLLQQLKTNLTQLVQAGETLAPQELYRRLDEEVLGEIPKQLTDLASVSLELALIQALARTDSIELPGVHLTPEAALELARQNRRDWMNVRASLVDSWRQIEFAADQLESQLDLVFDGDLGNTGDNPFRLSYKTGSLRAGFRFDSPLTRLSERNQYRQQLIQYQRDRRAYYEFVDEVTRGLRQTLREIELNKILFELNRRSVKVAVQGVEQSRFRLEEPPQSIAGAARGQLGATTARDLTGAINTLQLAQNSFLDVWVTFEVLRRDLLFDIDLFEVTPDGDWLDPKSIDESIGLRGTGNAPEAGGDAAPAELPPLPAPVEIQIEPAPMPNGAGERRAPGSNGRAAGRTGESLSPLLPVAASGGGEVPTRIPTWDGTSSARGSLPEPAGSAPASSLFRR